MDSPRRNRKTRRIVHFTEKIATALITVGGIGTIAAVALIFVFLVQVALPLFSDAELQEAEVLPEASRNADSRPVLHLVDEYRTQVAVLDPDGTVHVHAIDTGEALQSLQPFAEWGTPKSFSTSPTGKTLGYALADGSVGLARLQFRVENLTPEEAEEIPPLSEGEHRAHGRGILERTVSGRLRLHVFEAVVEAPLETEITSDIVQLAHTAEEGTSSFCAWTSERELYFFTREETLSFLTGESEEVLSSTQISFEPLEGEPLRMMLTGAGDSVLLIWDDGATQRLDTRNPDMASLAETADLVESDGDTVTALGFMLGSTTLLVGDSRGRIEAWFCTKPEGAETSDGSILSRGHSLFAGTGSPVRTFAPSPRSRLLGAGFEDGTLRLFQVTTEELLGTQDSEISDLEALRFAPKEDAIYAMGATRSVAFELDPGHSEATLTTMFRPVWYEGFAGPSHAWQAESATDEFEPKFGFVPLVYGTLKATFYSMIFGAPLALLAAIFTSEFLSRRLRVPIKSTIEIMASLPSVVLGFIAGSVIAPFAQDILPGILACFFAVPFALLCGAYIWQLLPQVYALRWSGNQRLFTISITLVLGLFAGVYAGPLLETLFFSGNIEAWLDGRVGSAVGGWLFLFLPLSALLVTLGWNPIFGSWFHSLTASMDRRQCAVADGLRFLLCTALVVGIGLALSFGLDVMGFDPRGSVMDTYVQRNALVVGFVMGFAIIPIIYTLTEDALTSVPEHLRLASLGAGATQWQTAIRIIIPTALSGIFSAVMIGLGRAVGETMIVLMATGNTPVMEMNIFNGFRTLSANIAVELPEAAKDGTHFRTLFLAALVLFAMTFVLNTLAEAVRQRVRKRSFQL